MCVAQEQHREGRKQNFGPFRFSTSWRKPSSAVWLWQLPAFAQQSQANLKRQWYGVKVTLRGVKNRRPGAPRNPLYTSRKVLCTFRKVLCTFRKVLCTSRKVLCAPDKVLCASAKGLCVPCKGLCVQLKQLVNRTFRDDSCTQGTTI